MKKYELNMSEGKIFRNIIIFSVPLILSSLLQLLFNAADMVIVGRFDGEGALAAVGSTSSLINLIINVFIGYSTGSSVVISRYFGANDDKLVKRAAHTSIATAFLFGVITLILGIAISRSMLTVMGTPDDVLDSAALYMKIYFVGMPSVMVYNFGSGVLRAVGDTKRPLIYLSVAGVINVVLNIIFVAGLGMGVAGVAWATTISQTVSAGCVLVCLVRTKASYGINLRELRIHKKEFIQMTKIGLPAGIQGSLFSISNVIIQSSINTFGSVAMAGSTAGGNLEGFIYVILNAIAQATLTFTAQNYGAGKRDRIKKGILLCLAFQFIAVFTLGMLMVIFSKQLLGIYTDNAESIKSGMERMTVICSMYFICGFNESIVAFLRGIGHPTLPTAVTVFGVCGLRLLYVYTVFKYFNTLGALFAIYPISWAITFVINGIAACVLWKKQGRFV